MKALAGLLTLALVCTGIGCGGAETQNRDVTLTVGSRDSAEEILLGEIYAQALERVGYHVKRKLGLPAGLPPLERKNVALSGYPEHLNLALKDVAQTKGPAPGDPKKAYELGKEKLEEKGMTAFPPAPFARSLSVVVLRKTATERNLRTLSDLKWEADRTELEGGQYCPIWANCLGGLERFYDMSFKSFTPAEAAERFKALETGEADAAFEQSTEGRFAEEPGKFTLLEDDRHLLPACNALWLSTLEAVDEAGPDYERAIVKAQKGMTLRRMQQMDAEVKLQKRPAARVAAEYLKSIHYTG
jgi:osmoprotectant transport system substrate-binding protein